MFTVFVGCCCCCYSYVFFLLCYFINMISKSKKQRRFLVNFFTVNINTKQLLHQHVSVVLSVPRNWINKRRNNMKEKKDVAHNKIRNSNIFKC